MLFENFKPALEFIFYITLGLSHFMSCEYIQSAELILNENIDIGSELINLNKLIDSQKQAKTIHSPLSLKEKSYATFKLVNDTQLVNFVDLKYLNDDTTLIVLMRKINFSQICGTLLTPSSTCSQTLKIIAINENDFIEIPIEIRKVRVKSKQMQFILKFPQSTINLNATKLTNTFFLDAAQVFASSSSMSITDNNSFSEKVDYLIESDPLNREYFDMSLLKITDKREKISLVVKFKSEMLLMKAHREKVSFNIRLKAMLVGNGLELFGQPGNIDQALANSNDSYLSIYLRVNGDDFVPMEPLSFEHPIYTAFIYDDEEILNVLRPKLKKPATKSSLEIVFSLFESSEKSGLPFSIDARTGEINLNVNDCDEEMFLNEKVYSFGIKATYKKLLLLNTGNEKDSYLHDYMIPAFAKIQISFKHKSIKTPQINVEILAPSVIVQQRSSSIKNEEQENKTFIFQINNSFEVNMRLVKLRIENKLDLMDWEFDEENTFGLTREQDGLTLRNNVKFRDENVYKISLRVIGTSRLKMRRQTILTRINLEFKVDFNPLLFEKKEYSVELTPLNFLGEKLVKIEIRKSNKRSMNASFSLSNEYFEINPTSGWIMAKAALNVTKSTYELMVVGTSGDLKKQSSVRVKIKLECFLKPLESQLVIFSLFENVPNRTLVGKLKSVCSDRNYLYELNQDEAVVKMCEKRQVTIKENCEKFNLDLSKLHGVDLFHFDSRNGNLMTNQVINLNMILNLIKNASTLNLNLNEEDLYESNHISLLLNVKIKSQINMDTISTYCIEISMFDSPRVLNLYESLIVVADANINTTQVSRLESANLNSNQCLYNYNFSLDPYRTSDAYTTSIIKFESIGLNQSNECTTPFVLDTGGCLSLRNDVKCFKSESDDEEKGNLLIREGLYTIKFNLCYNESSQISCSPFYNQTIIVEADVYNSSKLSTRVIRFDEQFTTTKLKVFRLLKNSNQSIILLVLLVTVLFIALITILSLIYYYFRTKLKRVKNEKFFCEKAFVLPSGGSETSSDSGMTSQMHSSSNTPETSSNVTTNSSKLSKLDDENDEIMKIQVSDDYFTKSSNSVKYGGYSCKNFSYAGSISSMNSSTREPSPPPPPPHHLLDEFCDTPILKPLECNVNNNNNHGLYSVKNASICYNECNMPPTSKSEPLSNLIVMSYEACPFTLGADNAFNQNLETDSIDYGNRPLENFYGIATNTNANSISNNNNPFQLAQYQSHSKVNSLKQLKKDLAIKKQVAASSLPSSSNFNFNNDNRISDNVNNEQNFPYLMNSQSEFYQNQHQQHKNLESYQYFKNSEIIIGQNDIIASVV